MTSETFLKYLLVPALAFATTYALTPLVMRLSTRLGMIDQPDERRIHTHPVPRAGGLAVFTGFHLACAAIFLLPWLPFSGQIKVADWLNIMGLGSLLVVIGLWDDRRGLPALVKLAAQIMIGCVAYSLNMRLGKLFGFALPVWLDLPATVFWFVAFINAFNLIDGMDGLATGLAAIAAFGLAGMFLTGRQPGDCLVMLALLGSCLAFLRFNFNPARIFLGDTGSMFLGGTLAALALHTSAKSTTITALIIPLLAVGIPMLDTFLAVWRRLARKILLGKNEGRGKVFGADIEHLHHRLLQTGLSQRRVAMLLYAAGFAMVVIALLATLFTSSAQGIFMVAFIVGVYITVRHIATVEMWTTAMALMKGLSRPQLRHLTVPLYMVADLAVLLTAHLAANILQNHAPHSWQTARTIFIEQAPLQVGIPFLCLAVGGRVYKRVWHMASTMDFAALGCWATVGILLGQGVALALGREPHPEYILRTTILYLGLALPPLNVLHAFMRLAGDSLAAMQVQDKRAGVRIPVLIYGARHRGMLFLRDQKECSLKNGATVRIMGFLDDDTNLHNRLIHGLPVLGGADQLESAFKKTFCQMVVVTTELSGASRSKLLDAAAKADVEVCDWEPVFRNMSQPPQEEYQRAEGEN